MLVPPGELIQYMSNISLTAPQEADVERTLNGVQSELERYCNRPLELVQVREARQTDNAGYLNTAISPVWKVISTTPIEVSYGPFPLNQFSPYIPAPMERDALIDPITGRPLVDWLSLPNVGDPLVVPAAIYIGIPNAWYAVEYVGGWYDPYWVDSARQAIKRVAARECSRQHDDTLSLRQGQAQQATEADPRPKGWTEEELKQFDRLRRRVIV